MSAYELLGGIVPSEIIERFDGAVREYVEAVQARRDRLFAAALIFTDPDRRDTVFELHEEWPRDPFTEDHWTVACKLRDGWWKL